MQKHLPGKAPYFLPVKTLTALFIILAAATIVTASFKNKDAAVNNSINPGDEITSKDSIESVKAFMQVYKVLKSPRCMNCHPAGDVPLQGDDSHLHAMSPKRGKMEKACMQ